MNNVIDEVAKLLMYSGPDFHELIAKSVMENKEIKIDEIGNCTILKTTFETAYNKKITDIYTFNGDKELIKQELQINQSFNIIFDKYDEAKNLLDKLPSKDLIAS